MIKKIRSSNMELLRILAMFLIITHHFYVHGGFDETQLSVLKQNEIWLKILRMNGTLGVQIFVLISGFFLSKQKEMRLDKLLVLYLEAVFYILLFWILNIVVNGDVFTVEEFLRHLLPVGGQRVNWFFSVYVMMFFALPTFFRKSVVYNTNDLVLFLCLYLLGGYMHKYSEDILNRKLWIWVMAFFGSWCLTLFYILFCMSPEGSDVIYEHNSFWSLLIALTSFGMFYNFPIGNSKIINFFGAGTLGVYFIHDSFFVRPILWEGLVKSHEYANSIYLIPYTCVVAILVFMICSMLEFLRRIILENRYRKPLSKIEELHWEYCKNDGVI